MLMMICVGSAELSMSQWSSLFAELGLNVSKSMGDLMGPCAFALLMGLSRLFYGIKGENIDLSKFLIGSSILCVISYLAAVFAPHPVLSLIGCAVTGLAVGIMWPGTFSLAAKTYAQGGTAMFALLALAGDTGCSAGPTLVGFVSAALGDDLKRGLLAAILFPVLILIGIALCRMVTKGATHENNT